MWLTDRTRVRLAQARNMLDVVHDDRMASLADIAGEFGVSPFHFIRQFEAAFGVTPHQFRIQQRLARAKALLASGRSVTDTCFEVGFSSLGTFSSLFTQRIGETPSAYRRRVRAMVQVHGLAPVLFPGCLSLLGQLPASAVRNFREAPERRSAHHGVCGSR